MVVRCSCDDVNRVESQRGLTGRRRARDDNTVINDGRGRLYRVRRARQGSKCRQHLRGLRRGRGRRHHRRRRRRRRLGGRNRRRFRSPFGCRVRARLLPSLGPIFRGSVLLGPAPRPALGSLETRSHILRERRRHRGRGRGGHILLRCGGSRPFERSEIGDEPVGAPEAGHGLGQNPSEVPGQTHHRAFGRFVQVTSRGAREERGKDLEIRLTRGIWGHQGEGGRRRGV